MQTMLESKYTSGLGVVLFLDVVYNGFVLWIMIAGVFETYLKIIILNKGEQCRI